jgi:hypothetical protein
LQSRFLIEAGFFFIVDVIVCQAERPDPEASEGRSPRKANRQYRTQMMRIRFAKKRIKTDFL